MGHRSPDYARPGANTNRRRRLPWALSTMGAAVLVAATALPAGASFALPPNTPAASFTGPAGSAEQLGAAVALSADGQEVLVGAPAANGGGVAYLYVESGGSWPTVPTATFSAPTGSGDDLGASVTMADNGQVALVGAPGAGSSGAAYLYVESGGAWPSVPTATLTALAGQGAELGTSVALSTSGQVALVGAPVSGVGAAYLYDQSAGGAWPAGPSATFLGQSGSGGEFGSSVALSATGGVALIGAPGAGSSYDGQAYLYAQAGGAWPSKPQGTFIGPPGMGAELGASVALSASGQEALVGAPGAGPNFDGLAYLYNETSNGTWSSSPANTFLGPAGSAAWLGQSVALSASGQVAFMGGPITGTGDGYLYVESGRKWPAQATATYTAPAGSPDQMGSWVALSANGEVAALGGAPFTGRDAIDGAAYLFSAPQSSSSSPSATSTAASQTIAFTSHDPTRVNEGTTYTPTAKATSQLPVTFSIDSASTPGACALKGATVKFTATGTCLIDANQSGSSSWAPAAQVQMEIVVQDLVPRIAVLSSSGTAKQGFISVELSCQDNACAGAAKLSRDGVLLAQGNYALKEGATLPVQLKITSAGRKLLDTAAGHALKGELVVSVRGGTQRTKGLSVS